MVTYPLMTERVSASVTSFTQVHAHLQAAALRCYPGSKLLVPTRGPYQHHSIRTWSSKDSPEPKFDLEQACTRSRHTAHHTGSDQSC